MVILKKKLNNMLLVILFCLLLVFPGCHRVQVTRELSQVKEYAQQITGYSFTSSNPEEALSKGLSRNDAIRLALVNNPSLQAQFETIGIAKADLVQAHLYTNPVLETGFQFPLPPTSITTQVSATLLFAFSDLWQVPVKKKVFLDQLDVSSLKVVDEVRLLIANVKLAYDTVAYTKTLLISAQEILHEMEKLEKDINQRLQFGLNTKSDLAATIVAASDRRVEILILEGSLEQARLDLVTLLGISPFSAFTLTDHFTLISGELPSKERAVCLALENRPDVALAQLAVKLSQDIITLARSQTVKQMAIGLGFNRDLDTDTGLGPQFRMELPFFDQNQAQVAKAEFSLRRAQRELEATKNKVMKEVLQAYASIENIKKQITLYQDVILPSHQTAVSFTTTFAQSMQITIPTLIQTRLEWYESKKNLLTIQFNFLKAWITLESALGKKLEKEGDHESRCPVAPNLATS
jgi:outer membrane protein, heavy metal efflux system